MAHGAQWPMVPMAHGAPYFMQGARAPQGRDAVQK